MTGRNKILIAMKHQGVCDAAAAMLQNEGFGVMVATRLRSALSQVSTDTGLVVCGLELDDISGTALLTYLKSDPLREGVPFVFLIHKKNEKALDDKDALALGAKDCIFYPIAEKEFIERIRKSFLARTVSPSPPARTAGLFAEISCDDRNWTSAQIIDHSRHGAMMETGLMARTGHTLKLKYLLPDGFLMATGKLNHILLGDGEKPMGIGVNFGKDENWFKIHTALKTLETGVNGGDPSCLSKKNESGDKQLLSTSQAVVPVTEGEDAHAVDLTHPPFSPISIEVSRDGNLWMPGKILRYGLRRAWIQTPVLGKPGTDIFLKCVLIQGQKTVTAAIEKLSLDDLKMPAGMAVFFRQNDVWLQVVEFFDELNATLLIEETEEISSPSKAGKAAAAENNSETVIIVNQPPEKPDLKIRFFESLIGKQMGNYEIVSLLGSGSMGGVFKGWDIALERSVALKVISYDLSSKKEFVDMFFKEARYISQLNHPNISHVYYIGKENDILYYAMEFVQGENLSEIIIRASRVAAKTAVKYLLSACRALDHVWRKKIIHRDIKPANIMITKEGEVKILDFGVAQQYQLDPAEIVENMAGSPPYICPEAIMGRTIDHRSDIYSLGATFYHALSGAPPFKGHSVLDIFTQHISVTPLPLRAKFADIPEYVSHVIDKMLAKPPEKRFQTYGEIITALERFEKE